MLDRPLPALDHVRQRLVARFPGVAPDLVDLAVETVSSTFTKARIRDFIPILVEREAIERLKRVP